MPKKGSRTAGVALTIAAVAAILIGVPAGLIMSWTQTGYGTLESKAFKYPPTPGCPG